MTLDNTDIPAKSDLPGRSSPARRRLRGLASRINGLFVLTVVVPTALAGAYYGLMASDIYISESRFVIRSSQRTSQTGLLGSLLQNTGFSRSQDDAFSVHDFIKSRDALNQLNQKFSLGKIFSDPAVDPLNRFSAIDRDDSFEALHKYYQKRVTVDADSTTLISVLRVNAFTADDAIRVNEALLAMSERLVNQLSDRARADIVRYASAEVDAAEGKSRAAAIALAAYRSKNAVVDPERQSSLQLQQISKLQDELIMTNAQLTQLRTFTPENPQIPALRNRAESLQKAMRAELSRVAGGGESLTNKAAAYERVALDRAFANRQLAAALASLELARNEALRKQLYLERIVQPNRPDVAIEPRRFRSVLVVFALGMLAWGILGLLVASVREHRD